MAPPVPTPMRNCHRTKEFCISESSPGLGSRFAFRCLPAVPLPLIPESDPSCNSRSTSASAVTGAGDRNPGRRSQKPAQRPADRRRPAPSNENDAAMTIIDDPMIGQNWSAARAWRVSAAPGDPSAAPCTQSQRHLHPAVPSSTLLCAAPGRCAPRPAAKLRNIGGTSPGRRGAALLNLRPILFHFKHCHAAGIDASCRSSIADDGLTPRPSPSTTQSGGSGRDAGGGGRHGASGTDTARRG